jgi:low temperature requirement protein LtrA
VTQLAAYLVDNITAEGLVRALVLFLALWWLWITTTWATNRLDPDRELVRGVIFALMGAGLMFSVSIPRAFDDRAHIFAAAYVIIQVGRSLFMVWALHHGGDHQQRDTFRRATLWFCASGLLWIGGAFAEADLRIVLWAVALVIDLAVPWAGFWFPGLGRSSAREWNIEGEHLAERCGLFIILALGESLLVTGTRLESLSLDATTLASFAIALVGSLAMWWIYFDTGQQRGTKAFERSDEPGRLARFAYTYVHLPIVAGVVVLAVGTSSSSPTPRTRRATRRRWSFSEAPLCSCSATTSSRTLSAGAGLCRM